MNDSTVEPPDLNIMNRYLLGLLGSKELVRQWWNSPNIAFGMATPLDVYAVPGGDARVYQYVMYHASK